MDETVNKEVITTVRLDPDMHRRLKIRSATDGDSMKTIHVEALERELRRRERRDHRNA